MRKRLAVSVVLAMILAVSAGAGFAREGGCKKSKGHHEGFEYKSVMKAHMILKNKDELGLSEKQVKKIKTLKLKAKKELIRQNAEIEIITLDIKAMMWGDDVDTEAINALIDEKYEIKKARAKSTIAACVELKGILTEKQKEKLKDLHKQYKIGKKKSHH